MLALGSRERKECPSGCASGCATKRVLQLVHVRPTVSALGEEKDAPAWAA